VRQAGNALAPHPGQVRLRLRAQLVEAVIQPRDVRLLEPDFVLQDVQVRRSGFGLFGGLTDGDLLDEAVRKAGAARASRPFWPNLLPGAG
jgi:hypothetical protein